MAWTVGIEWLAEFCDYGRAARRDFGDYVEVWELSAGVGIGDCKPGIHAGAAPKILIEDG